MSRRHAAPTPRPAEPSFSPAWSIATDDSAPAVAADQLDGALAAVLLALERPALRLVGDRESGRPAGAAGHDVESETGGPKATD